MSEVKTVLIVDDDPDFLTTNKIVVESAGYNVVTATDSLEAQTVAEAENPDLILMDVVMEEVDAGFVFAEKFAKTYDIILLSSIADSSVKVFDVHELPVKGVLQKPIRPDALLDAVSKALKA